MRDNNTAMTEEQQALVRSTRRLDLRRILGGLFLVYGIGKIDLHGDSVATDTAWYRSPALLGTVALVLCVVLYLPFL